MSKKIHHSYISIRMQTRMLLRYVDEKNKKRIEEHNKSKREIPLADISNNHKYVILLRYVRFYYFIYFFLI